MKKLFAILLAAMMLLSLVACGGSNETEAPENETPATDAPENETPETDAPAVELAYKNAEELLSQIYNGYNESVAEEFQIWAMGGNIYNFDTIKEGSPATFVPTSDEDYNTHFGYPAADAGKIDDAASMYHAMNVNIFNCYAVHFANSTDVDAMVETLKENILARHWECGHPERLYIVKVPGDYLVVTWGVVSSGGVAQIFGEKIPSLVEGATIVVDIPLI